MTTPKHRSDPLRDMASLGGDPDDLAAQAKPLGPQPGAGPKRVEISEMVLPPAHLVDELDNASAAVLEEEPADEEVTLDFFGDDLPVRAFPLRHPFTWAGERVEAIEVHQLTTAEVGKVSTTMAKAGGTLDLYEIYAHMARVQGTGTRVPARVLRKLPSIDGLQIVDAAYDFLPPLFLPEAG